MKKIIFKRTSSKNSETCEPVNCDQKYYKRVDA